MTTGQDIIDFIKNNNLENEFVEMCVPNNSQVCTLSFAKPTKDGAHVFFMHISAKRSCDENVLRGEY